MKSNIMLVKKKNITVNLQTINNMKENIRKNTKRRKVIIKKKHHGKKKEFRKERKT